MTKQQMKRQVAANVFALQNNIMRQYSEPEESCDWEAPANAPMGIGTGGSLSAGSAMMPQAPRGRARTESEVDALESEWRVSSSSRKSVPPADYLISSEELQLQKEPIQVKEVGIWPFKRVLVPPNVYIVHTRLGRKAPVTIGMGISFHYNPYTDAYLSVPAAMQTIGIVANSISEEKQGINVLAYVQWQIQDFSIAYRKLDFSDLRDPLGVVNAQLREQAEAAIKDKIATMTVDEVLTDKQPIIEELTERLKSVAEGRGEAGTSEGLGIKIVTVQIKEAYVSSVQLWEHLQAPFRNEQQKRARISSLQANDAIRQKELENRQLAETSQATAMVHIERAKQASQTEALQCRLNEERTRLTYENETTERRAALQVQRKMDELLSTEKLADAQLEHEKLRIQRARELKLLEAELAALVMQEDAKLQSVEQEATLARRNKEQRSQMELDDESQRFKLALERQEIELARLRQDNDNLVSANALACKLIEKLPELAAQMPDVHELKVLQTGDVEYNALASFLSRMMTVAQSLGVQLDKKEPVDRA